METNMHVNGQYSSETGEPFKYSRLEGQQCWIVAPPRIKSMMSGAQMIMQNKAGMARIVYTDGSDEFADCRDFDIQDKEFFDLVGIVQERARSKAKGE